MSNGVAMGAESNERGAVAPLSSYTTPAALMLSMDPHPEQDTPAFNPREIARILFRWRLLILALVMVGAIVGVIITLSTTPLYRATTTMEINQPDVQLTQGDSVQPVAVRDPQFLATQYGLLRSRALAERVARSLNLANNPAFAPPGASRELRERSAASVTAGNFVVMPVTGSRLVTLTYTSPDPTMAAEIVNAYAEGFIASDLERRYDTTADARRFLQNRLATIKAALERSERTLVQYAQQQGIVVVGAGSQQEGVSAAQTAGTSLEGSSLVAYNAALTEAENARIVAEGRLREGSAGITAEMLSDTTIQQLSSRRAQVQSEFDQKSDLYRADYPLMLQLRSQIRAIDTQIARQKGGIVSSLRSEYEAAAAHERSLRARVNQLKSSVLDTRNRSIEYNILQREVDTNHALYDALLQRFKEIGVAGRVGASLASVVDRASAPKVPFSPNMIKNLVLAIIIGLAAGVALAFFVEFIDDTIKSSEDVRRKLRLTPLGAIPAALKGEDLIEAIKQPQNPLAEAYFSVCTSIQFSSTEGIPKSLLLASARAAEGKSSSAVAVAHNFARMGRMVLLIDADMRRPSFAIEHQGEPGAIGLSNLLTSHEELRDHVVRTWVDDVWLLPSGRVPPNPAELLASERMRELLRLAEEEFDVVVVDGPPVLGLADSPLLSSMCRATVFVIEAGVIRRPAAISAIGRLRAAGGNVVGVVLTKMTAKTSGYGYGYGYGYGGDDYSYGGRINGGDGKRQIALSK